MAGKLFAKHFVRKLFLEDWGLKLIALVITLALWLGVTGLSTPTTRRITVPLNIYVSNNAEITNAPLQEVEIVITGDKARIDQINKSDLTATRDLTDELPGDRVVSLSPENVSIPLPQGVKLVEVTPSRIPVNLEAIAEREIDVKPQTEGSPATGFEVYSVSVSPPKIRVRGPASFINTLDFVETVKIDLSGKKGEFTAKQMPVSVSNPKAAVLNTVVDVYFRIGEKRVERTFTMPLPDKPARTVTFIVYGPRSLLAKARADAFKVVLVPDGELPNVQVELPPDLQDVAKITSIKSNLRVYD